MLDSNGREGSAKKRNEVMWCSIVEVVIVGI